MTASLAIACAMLGANAAPASNAGMCPKVHGRASYDKAWQKVVSEKRIAVEAGIKHLEQQRQLLATESDAASERELVKVLLLVPRETLRTVINVVELVRAGPIIHIVSQPTSKGEKIAAGAVVTDELLQAAFDNPDTKASDALSLAIEDRIANIEGLVPGLTLTSELDDIIAARNKYRKRLTAITQELAMLQKKLQDLGGPERKYTIDALLESARADQNACVASTKLKQLKKPEPWAEETAAVAPALPADKTRKPQALHHTSTAPVAAGCAILDTCNK